MLQDIMLPSSNVYVPDPMLLCHRSRHDCGANELAGNKKKDIGRTYINTYTATYTHT